MSEIKCPDNYVFGLDIGTRSLVGTIGYEDSYGFHIVAMEVMEHATRAMLDGQVHDISVVGEEIKQVKEKLERKINRKLSGVCIAAAVSNLTVVSTTVGSFCRIDLNATLWISYITFFLRRLRTTSSVIASVVLW